MKRLTLPVLFMISAICSANPLIGCWKLEAAFSPNPFILQFIDGSTYLSVEVNVNSPQYQEYSIDEPKNLVNLGKLDNVELLLRYKRVGDSRIDFYLCDNYFDRLIERSFNRDSPGGNNDLSTNFRKQFTKAMKSFAATTPFARATRLGTDAASAFLVLKPKAADSERYPSYSKPLAYYDNIDAIRGQTADDPPAIFLLRLSIGYEPQNREVVLELAERMREIQDLILKYVASKTAAQLGPANYDQIQSDLRDLINEIVESGEIKNVTFREFSVVLP